VNIGCSIPSGAGEHVNRETRAFAVTVACEGNRAYLALRQSPPIRAVTGLNCRG
jgi:hypothetical protein